MSEILGDTGFDNKPSIEAKALRINLNKYIYGTFAEIGAGQEVARHFFRVGGASGTIAKTISAYDKNFSDTIYGEEEDSRYVTETRLDKMLSHEMRLLKNRIPKEDHPNKMFFTFADTVATIDFAKKFMGHGWMVLHALLGPTNDSIKYRKLLAIAGRWTKPPACLELMRFFKQSFKPIVFTLGPTSRNIIAMYADGKPACLV